MMHETPQFITETNTATDEEKKDKIIFNNFAVFSDTMTEKEIMNAVKKEEESDVCIPKRQLDSEFERVFEQTIDVDDLTSKLQ